MDGRGRGIFKKDSSKWLEKYNSWSREVAWNCDGGKNSCRVVMPEEEKEEEEDNKNNFGLYYRIVILENVILCWVKCSR